MICVFDSDLLFRAPFFPLDLYDLSGEREDERLECRILRVWKDFAQDDERVGNAKFHFLFFYVIIGRDGIWHLTVIQLTETVKHHIAFLECLANDHTQ